MRASKNSGLWRKLRRMDETSRGKTAKSSWVSSAMMADQWLAKNGEALRSSNAFVDAHGLPLA